MHDRNSWRLFVEAWRQSASAVEAARSEDPRTRRLLAEIEESLAETEKAIGELRDGQAALLRALRALSRKLQVDAARPLPRCSANRPFPDDGGVYGIRHHRTDAGPCADCGEEAGTGPVGWRKGDEPEPLCHDCLIKADRRLFAVPLMADFMREAGALELESREEEVSMKSLLMTTATLAEERNFKGLPGWPVDPETMLAPLLARLREARLAEEDGEVGEEVSH